MSTTTAPTAGTTCETGFKDLDPAHLQPNVNMEFSEASGKPMPNLSDYRVSVMYSLCESDGTDASSMAMFEASLASVVEHFPDALEVVLVVAGRHKHLFGKAVEKVASYAPYTVRLVSDEVASEVEHRDQSRRRLSADEFCLGDYVLHVKPNDVLFQKVTYDVVFHFEKPVVPYGRHPEGECGSHGVGRDPVVVVAFDEVVGLRGHSMPWKCVLNRVRSRREPGGLS